MNYKIIGNFISPRYIHLVGMSMWCGNTTSWMTMCKSVLQSWSGGWASWAKINIKDGGQIQTRTQTYLGPKNPVYCFGVHLETMGNHLQLLVKTKLKYPFIFGWCCQIWGNFTIFFSTQKWHIFINKMFFWMFHWFIFPRKTQGNE